MTEAIQEFEHRRLLFIGDSITDCGRREDERRSLGCGYVAMITDLLTALYPRQPVEIINRGIGGDRVVDLEARWDEDVIALNPDWLSISIGINDIWRGLSPLAEVRAQAIHVDHYRDTYRKLLQRVVTETKARIILMETSIIDEDLASQGNQRSIEYNRVVQDLADEFKADLIPINRAFREAIAAHPGMAWTTDGVHPHPNGHMLMAVTWLKAMRLLA
ncbi:MAG: SGNH/GDSL hydrolase family protein [Kiritimatiellae bacterium]|nr:SGNH/GDSL hydrolase family protein [Kiritimatiellia bacterium]